jgi:hypothetical protein
MLLDSSVEHEVIFMFANGNSFGSSAASTGDKEGNEKSILSSRWMFPGGSGSGTQQLGNAL